jgi:hypothetical protein
MAIHARSGERGMLAFSRQEEDNLNEIAKRS